MVNKKTTNRIKIPGGKKMREAIVKIDENSFYKIADGITVLKDVAFAKFDETLEIAVQLGVDPKHSDQMVRGVVSMPAGTGKTVKIAVICKEDRYEEARQAGADIVGGQDIIDSIKENNINCDIYISTPDMMGIVGQVARILGPRGLMPNPKLGTVATDIKKIVQEKKAGQIEFKVDKAGIVHAGIGKVTFNAEDLEKNVKAFADALVKARPLKAKGVYMKKLHLSTTMGPSVKIDLSSLGLNL
jgi:large subunit ribosomal protein L1